MSAHSFSRRWLALTTSVVALAALAPSAGRATTPPGTAVPTRLVGLYKATFSSKDEQTSGVWHIRLGPGHHLKIWNTADPIAYSPSFEAGPVSFRGNLMVFAEVTAQGICTSGAVYAWSLHSRALRFRLVGDDTCAPRKITFTPHPWLRSI